MKTIPAFAEQVLARLDSHANDLSAWATVPLKQAETDRMAIAALVMQAGSDAAQSGEIPPGIASEHGRISARIEQAVTLAAERRRLAAEAMQVALQVREFLTLLPQTTHLRQVAPGPVAADVELKPALAKIRSQITELHSEMGRLRARPVERAEIAELAGREVARRAGAALSFHPARGLSEIHIATVLGLICATMPAQVTSFLTDTYVDTFGRGGLGDPITTPERDAANAELADQLLDLERHEEAIVQRLHADGILAVTRRATCAPLAVLGAAIGPTRRAQQVLQAAE